MRGGDLATRQVVDGGIAFLNGDGLNVGGNDRDYIDVVDVGHPVRGVRQANGVLSLLQLDGDSPRAHLLPVAAIGRERRCLLAVHADGDIAVLAGDKGYRQPCASKRAVTHYVNSSLFFFFILLGTNAYPYPSQLFQTQIRIHILYSSFKLKYASISFTALSNTDTHPYPLQLFKHRCLSISLRRKYLRIYFIFLAPVPIGMLLVAHPKQHNHVWWFSLHNTRLYLLCSKPLPQYHHQILYNWQYQ